MSVTWFNTVDIPTVPIHIVDGPVYGYVLPHAGTAYTGALLAHILRFRPRNWKSIKYIHLYYYPANPDDSHELEVPQKALLQCIGKQLTIHPVNVANNEKPPTTTDTQLGLNTWIVISADMSHHMPMQKALELENISIRALEFRAFDKPDLFGVVDTMETFQTVFSALPAHVTLRWVGRTRSPGSPGVGYAGFLIVKQHEPTDPDGLFVTCYDSEMTTRECLGNWFDSANPYTKEKENELVQDVLHKGATTSRLTGGQQLDQPIRYYTITYLYEARPPFIRGWHGVLANNAFYLPDVFLENTYENGVWIDKDDTAWLSIDQPLTAFKMNPTLSMLAMKSGTMQSGRSYTCYDGYVKHVSLSS